MAQCGKDAQAQSNRPVFKRRTDLLLLVFYTICSLREVCLNASFMLSFGRVRRAPLRNGLAEACLATYGKTCGGTEQHIINVGSYC